MDCDCDFEHTCNNIGYSKSVDHNDQWYCKNAYFIFLAAKDKVRKDDMNRLNAAIQSVSKSGGKS